MPLTLDELNERLAERVDEITLMEILNINSYDLIAMFGDRVEDKLDELLEEFDE